MISNVAMILAVQCPLLSQQGAPVFYAMNITNSLHNWVQCTDKYGFSDKRKMANLPDYSDLSIATYMDTVRKIAKAEIFTIPTATDEEIGTVAQNVRYGGGRENVEKKNKTKRLMMTIPKPYNWQAENNYQSWPSVPCGDGNWRMGRPGDVVIIVK